MKTKKTKKFSNEDLFRSQVWLDIWNWKETYAEMQRLNELTLEDEEVITISLSRKKPIIDVKISRAARVQMYIYMLIINDQSFVNDYCRNIKGNIKKDLKNIAIYAIKEIKNICNILNSDFFPSRSYELNEYKKRGNIASRSIHIDDDNRFVYRVIPEYNRLEILEVMFHYDDKPLEGNLTQQIMVDMFDQENSVTPTSDIPNYLLDLF